MIERNKTMNLKSTITKYFILILFMWQIPYSGFAQDEDQNEGRVIDKIVGKVDDYVILKSEVERGYLDMLSRGEVENEDEKCNILESLITHKMLLAQAEIDSIIVMDAEVSLELDRRMSYFLQQFGGSKEELEAYYGKSMEQIQDDISDELKEQLTANRMRDQLTAEVVVTPSEVRKFYNNIPKDSLPYFSEEVIVAQIVKIPDLSKDQREETRKLLLDIKSRVLSGEDFGDLALQYSEDPESAANEGEYPNFIKRGKFVPEFEAAAFKLKINEISEPVESDFGFHLIQLLDRRGNVEQHWWSPPRVLEHSVDFILGARLQIVIIRNI